MQRGFTQYLILSETQNHSAEHFACHTKQHDVMSVFTAAQVAKRTR